MIFGDALSARAAALLEACRARKLSLATAESCTGGLVAGLLTSIAGASDVFEAGFVTYSNAAKTSVLGVPEDLIEHHGAVSEAVARAMAECTVAKWRTDAALAVTGIAGPGGGSAEKPVGLVHVAVAISRCATAHRRLLLGNPGREEIRLLTIGEVLELALDQVMAGGP